MPRKLPLARECTGIAKLYREPWHPVNGNEDRRIHPCHLELDQSAAQTKITSESAEPASAPEAAEASDSDTGSRAIPRHQTQTLQYEYGSIRAAPFYHDWARDPKDLEPEISAMKLASLAYEHTLEEMLSSIKNRGEKPKGFRSKRWALYVAIYILTKDLNLDRKRIASFLSGISGRGLSSWSH